VALIEPIKITRSVTQSNGMFSNSGETGEPEGKRLLRRPRCKREDNIKMHHRETGRGGMDWIQWRAYMNKIINFQVP
jgi:hypothetical protein